MTNDVFSKNMKFLKTYQPSIYNKIDGYIKGVIIPRNKDVEKIIVAKDENFIINLIVISNNTEFLLVNHENPILQSYYWIEQYIDPANSVEIVFGIGMAFHLEVLLESFKNKTLILVEPNIELFYQILKIKNLENIIKKSKIFLDEDIDIIMNYIYKYFWNVAGEGVQCEPFWVYAAIFPTAWDTLKSKFIKLDQSLLVDISTRKQYGELWVKNSIKNLKKLSNTSNSQGLINKFKNIPAVLVSAGPSLSKNYNFLKELKDKAIIMAAGTASVLLSGYDIKPHFMMAIDATEGETKKLSKVKFQDVYFLYSNQVSTGIIDIYKGPKFLMNYSMDFYTADFLKYINNPSELFQSGPSVANTCLDVLVKMGCNPIIFIGQDLAYVSGSFYAEGQNTEKKNNDDLILEKDIYGEDIFTDLPLLSIKNWFDEYVKRLDKNINLINATEGGLGIEGVPNETLKNIIENYKFNKIDIENYIKNIYKESLFSLYTLKNIDKYQEFVKSEINTLKDFIKSQIEMLDMLKNNKYSPVKNKAKFDTIIFQISNFSNNLISSKIYNAVLKNIIEIDLYFIKLNISNIAKSKDYKTEKDELINGILEQCTGLLNKLENILIIL